MLNAAGLHAPIADNKNAMVAIISQSFSPNGLEIKSAEAPPKAEKECKPYYVKWISLVVTCSR
jgi:hypothetical protein